MLNQYSKKYIPNPHPRKPMSKMTFKQCYSAHSPLIFSCFCSFICERLPIEKE